MDTFEGKVYTISTSLNERTIYIKIIDTIQYLNYEGNIELKEFRMPITLQDAYLLVTNCFSETKDHSVSFSKNTNVLRLDFKAKVGGYMNIGFEFILRETAIGGDAKASMQMIEMERKHKKEMCEIMERIDRMTQHYDSKIESLEQTIQKQEQMIEIFGNLQISSGIPISINSDIVNIDHPNLASKCCLFYNCKKLTLNNNLPPYISENLLSFKNNSVEELIITHEFKSLYGLQHFPNLKILNINFAQNTIGNYMKEFVRVITSYHHTITQIIIHQHRNKEDPTELQTYCKKNNIDLIVQ
jgi:hypothetical protein